MRTTRPEVAAAKLRLFAMASRPDGVSSAELLEAVGASRTYYFIRDHKKSGQLISVKVPGGKGRAYRFFSSEETGSEYTARKEIELATKNAIAKPGKPSRKDYKPTPLTIMNRNTEASKRKITFAPNPTVTFPEGMKIQVYSPPLCAGLSSVVKLRSPSKDDVERFKNARYHEDTTDSDEHGLGSPDSENDPED